MLVKILNFKRKIYKGKGCLPQGKFYRSDFFFSLTGFSTITNIPIQFAQRNVDLQDNSSQQP